MADPLTLTLIPLITGGISATVQIALAIIKFWQAQKDRRTQAQAYQNTAPTSTAAKNLQSLMGVQSSFWKSNPALFQALGTDAARIPFGCPLY
jgi:ABC-type sulfate transport system permease component